MCDDIVSAIHPPVGLNGQPIIEIWHSRTTVLIRIENVYAVTARTTGNATLQRNILRKITKKVFASFSVCIARMHRHQSANN